MKWIGVGLCYLALAAFAVYFNIYLMLVGGIKEIVAGAQAHPADGSQIAWGVVKACVFAGAGTVLAIVLAMLVTFWALERPARLPRRRR